jgi:chromatin segregation and condensation protein Rec8/ScpA/Scc1 (kleisin family)
VKFSRAIVVNHEGEPSLSLEGLEGLERVLKRGDPVIEDLRGELVGLLDYLIFGLIVDEVDSRPGRRRSMFTKYAAMIAEALSKKHSVSLTDAVLAVVSDKKYVGRVTREVSKLRRGKVEFNVSDAVLDLAAARLPHKIRK